MLGFLPTPKPLEKYVYLEIGTKIIVLIFKDSSEDGRIHDICSKHSKMFVGPNMTKSNRPYVAKPSNNTK